MEIVFLPFEKGGLSQGQVATTERVMSNGIRIPSLEEARGGPCRAVSQPEVSYDEYGFSGHESTMMTDLVNTDCHVLEVSVSERVEFY